MSDTKKILIAVAAGIAVGAIAGVLLAPDKGSNTRKKIIDEGQNLAGAVKEKFKVCEGRCQDVKEAVS